MGGQNHEPRCFRSRNSYILTPERSSGAPRLPRQPAWERVPGAGSSGNACALGSAPLADWRHALGAPPSPSSPPFGRSGRAFRSPEPLQEAGKRRVAELQGERLRALAGTGVKARGAPAPPGEGASPGNSGLGSSCCAPWFLRSVGAPPPGGGHPGRSRSPRGMERGQWVTIPCPLQIPNCPGSEASAGLAGLCSCTPAALGTTWLVRSWSLRGARIHAEP